MNTRSPFDPPTLSFRGSPLQQAQSLLRFVARRGNVEDTNATLPAVLQSLLTTADSLGVTVAQVRTYLQLHAITEGSAGGSLDAPVCRANGNSPSGRKALYFLIHDTSSKLRESQTFDPNFINTTAWDKNNLANAESGLTHIYISRLGEARTDKDYGTAWRATQFESRPDKTLSSVDKSSVIFKGLCLHHELIQPRKGPGDSDVDSPNPGFTHAQYDRLALQYIIASVRRGSWMIPAFHGVIDLSVGDHDDPQSFDLAAWGASLDSILTAIRGTDAGGHLFAMLTPVPLRSKLLSSDPVLVQVAAGQQILGVSQIKAAEGVEPLQDALNLLAGHGSPALAVPGARAGSSSRGFYGQQTLAAVRAFQTQQVISPADGQTGWDTILPLDAAVLAIEGAHDGDTVGGVTGTPTGTFETPATSSSTKNDKGASTTTGLSGTIFETDNGTTVTDASEKITAKREGHSLGLARIVRQIRTKRDDLIVVHQPDYCWGSRVLLDAELEENSPGFAATDAGVFSGKATFFGKSDKEDEGTGTSVYGTTQTNSSVFGISLKQDKLIAEGLATLDSDGGLEPTDKGLKARVEVFFPTTKRLVRLPLVDVGPSPGINAIADLTVAASVFLQKLTEEEVTKKDSGNIDNIQVRAHIIA